VVNLMNSEEHVLDYLPAYALGILEDDEALQVDRHLAVCEVCRMELRANQQVVDQLPLAVPIVETPSGLRASIQAAARESSVKGAGVSAKVTGREPAGVFPRWMPVWGVFTLVLIVALGAINIYLWNQLRNTPPPVQSSMQVLSLNPTDFMPGATGLMIVGGDGHVGALVVDNLPALDEDHAYQLWLINDGERVSGGVFEVSEEGYGYKYIHSDLPLLSYSGFGVTVEPAEGSPGPTGEKVLGFDF
jgi:anti-sigma-K factor RskA